MTQHLGYDVAIVGGGFSGLAAAYEFACAGKRVVVIEKDAELGGLAGGFKVGEHVLEKFYHHWFSNDVHVMRLISEMGLESNVLLRPTRTGMYYANQFFRLSSPLDLLRFQALPFIDRIRLGAAVLRVRMIRDWRPLEKISARQWLLGLCGRRAYDVVWDPLLVGKFGALAEEVSAAWFWKKLVLRGGSRGRAGEEILAYYRGGFAALADAVADRITSLGGDVMRSTGVTGLMVHGDGMAGGVETTAGAVAARHVLITTPLPVTADLLAGHVPWDYARSLRRIRYLANVCLVLSLKRSLSDTYWLNVNDPEFPFVGVIEHTNFEPSESYGGRHIVYLSKYLPSDAELYRMPDGQLLEFALPHLKRMFPEFEPSWILDWHVWRAEHAQPIAETNYSELIPDRATPLPNVHITSMAQIYPEDRGTNYAIREGRETAQAILGEWSGP